MALSIIEQNAPAIQLQLCDIDSDHTLYDLYDIRVPVLVNEHNKELFWHFDSNDLHTFLTE